MGGIAPSRRNESSKSEDDDKASADGGTEQAVDGSNR